MLEKFTYLNTVENLLRNVNGCSEISEQCGVYVVTYSKSKMPKFKQQGSGPEMWHDRKVNVSVEKLISKWIIFRDGEEKIIYIGRAGGEGISSNLRNRIKRYILFGSGCEVAHYGGRYIWQIANPKDMAIYWQETRYPAETERRLINDFKYEHEGKLPFANLKGGDKIKTL